MGTRAAGVVIALGYLSGIVPGPIVAVVGGLGLMTYGHQLLVERRAALVAGAALAVLGGALGVAALRWGALGLSEIRGVQSVLGPTLLVGPPQSAVASGIAAGAGLVALGVWLALPWPSSRGTFVGWGIEAVIGAVALVSVFFDPAQPGLWTLAVVAASAVAGGGAWLLHKVADVWRAAVVSVAGAAAIAAAALLVSVR